MEGYFEFIHLFVFSCGRYLRSAYHVLYAILSIKCPNSRNFHGNSRGMGALTIVAPILQKRKQRHKEVGSLVTYLGPFWVRGLLTLKPVFSAPPLAQAKCHDLRGRLCLGAPLGSHSRALVMWYCDFICTSLAPVGRQVSQWAVSSRLCVPRDWHVLGPSPLSERE